MRAVEITAYGAPDVLRLADRADPQAAAGEVLIRVGASGVNRPDVLQRTGNYPVPAGASDIPGLEVAGEIIDGDAQAMASRPGAGHRGAPTVPSRPTRRVGIRIGGCIIMNHRVSFLLVGVAACGQMALADGQIRLSDSTGRFQSPGSGGAFVMTVLNGYAGQTGDLSLAAPNFLTFCVERTSYMSFGVTYFGEIATSSSTGTSKPAAFASKSGT